MPLGTGDTMTNTTPAKHDPWIPLAVQAWSELSDRATEAAAAAGAARIFGRLLAGTSDPPRLWVNPSTWRDRPYMQDWHDRYAYAIYSLLRRVAVATATTEDLILPIPMHYDTPEEGYARLDDLFGPATPEAPPRGTRRTMDGRPLPTPGLSLSEVQSLRRNARSDLTVVRSDIRIKGRALALWIKEARACDPTLPGLPAFPGPDLSASVGHLVTTLCEEVDRNRAELRTLYQFASTSIEFLDLAFQANDIRGEL